MEYPLATKGKFVAVDEADLELLGRYSWYAIKCRNSWYAYAKTRREDGKIGYVAMHRFILGLSKQDLLVVDHRDGDGLNNQRDNLRTCTRLENRWNSSHGKIPLGASGFRGVAWDKRRLQWRWLVVCNGRSYSHGPYPTAEAAAIAREAKVAELHGEFARSQIGP